MRIMGWKNRSPQPVLEMPLIAVAVAHAHCLSKLINFFFASHLSVNYCEVFQAQDRPIDSQRKTGSRLAMIHYPEINLFFLGGGT